MDFKDMEQEGEQLGKDELKKRYGGDSQENQQPQGGDQPDRTQDTQSGGGTDQSQPGPQQQ